MFVKSLKRICLHRIYSLLKDGAWKTCIANPFSNLPTRLANRLMEFLLLKDFYLPIIDDFILPLTSGSLTCLYLPDFRIEEVEQLMARALQTGNKIFLENHASHSEDINFPNIYVLRYIITSNPYLEELHLDMDPGSDVIGECKNLRILRINSSDEEFSGDLSSTYLPMLSSLRNLKVLYVAKIKPCTMSKVLEMCPNLISVGLCDSLDSLDIISQRPLNTDVGRQFKLQRCVWGRLLTFNNLARRLHKLRFHEKIRSAVILCPLVKELILDVHVKEAITDLKFLKQLSLLKINFYECLDDFVMDFVALLQVIGTRLNHLSISSSRRIPVNDICDKCPHLKSLEIEGPKYVKPDSDYSGYLPLKRITLESTSVPDDKECLLFLLSISKNLEELFLYTAEIVDDALVNEMLERNLLTKLVLCFISFCNVTKDGYALIIENAASLEKVHITNFPDNVFIHDVGKFKEAEYKTWHPDIEENEFFCRQLSKKRF